ncbi:hypothetical protein H6G89_13575 [Oscillatoria sp. FACHB-1407]|uniref:hypothetical protein n=1 Tax=Oscillatoria sp. FACHB-1407 TaxID=2692847 RepID=UPI0016861EE5|nr:hypothetical protein [Oscillatoria sp. FACHB-1407]MBD2462079.1 hypothetical protein [Oscillatoria sp. FACHB-1407]
MHKKQKAALLILGMNELRAGCSHWLKRFALRECERLAYAYVSAFRETLLQNSDSLDQQHL